MKQEKAEKQHIKQGKESSGLEERKMKKAAIYGAIQRLLDKVNVKYPYLGDEMYELDHEHGTLPVRFWFAIGLRPDIASFERDYRNCERKLGDALLKELLKT